MKTIKRLSYLDITKGITLFFVILGHFVYKKSLLFKWIFTFHIPVFFIISGILFNINNSYSFKDYLKRKLKRLILPYFIISSFGFLISLIIRRKEALSITAIEYLLYYGQPELFQVGQIWFLIALFNASILLYLIIKIFYNNKKISDRKIVTIIILIVLISIGYIIKDLIKIPHFGRLPFKIDTSIMGTAFMFIGYIIKEYNILDKINNNKIKATITFILLIIINVLFGVKLNNFVNICMCSYGNIFYYIISAISGSICIL